MPLTLVTVEPRASRRLRLVFDRQLAVSAFTSTSFYSIESVDSAGPKPAIKAALQVGGSVGCVELVLSQDLVEGGAYTITCTAVPAQDASTFTGTHPFEFGARIQVRSNVDPVQADADSYLFGIDLVWTGEDFLETPQGDLATVGGLENVQAANNRRGKSSGLPWNADYGAKLDELVGAPPTSQLTGRGRIVEQMLRDDRNEACEVAVIYDDTAMSERVDFQTTIVLRGGRRAPPFTIAAGS